MSAGAAAGLICASAPRASSTGARDAGQIRGPVDEMIDQHNPIIPRARSGRRGRWR
jgi:hypothetical protein